MALNSVYGQHNYLGEYATEADALAFIRAAKWDSTSDGLGDPRAGMFFWDTTASKFKVHSGSGWVYVGVADHGELTGLSDDGHSIYIKADGTRAFTGPVAGVSPTDATHLTTKGYVDTLMQGVHWQESVSDKDLSTAPNLPVAGDRYIIGKDATAPAVITGVNTGTKTFTLAGDLTTELTTGMVLNIKDSTGNNGWYTIVSVTFNTPDTDVVVSEVIADATVDGSGYWATIAPTANITGVTVGTSTFTLAGDLSAVVLTGMVLEIRGSTGNDGLYTVVSSTFNTPDTDVVVSEVIADATVDGYARWNGNWDEIGVGYIVTYEGPEWTSFQPHEGYAAWVDDEDIAYIFNGIRWVKLTSVFAHNDLNGLQGGTTGQYYHLTSAEHTEITTFFANTDITGAEAETLTDGSDASLLHNHASLYSALGHDHDDRYYTETELGSTTATTEGASLIGTDTKIRLNNATTVEAALTWINSSMPNVYTGAGINPNGVTTASAIGDIYVSTTSPNLRYMAKAATNSDWTII